MKSPFSTFLIIFLSIIVAVLLFNRGTVTETVTDTYHTYISHHLGSSTASPPTPKPHDAVITDTTSLSVEQKPAPLPQPPRFPLLTSLCSNTTFIPSLYLHCHSWGGPHSNAIHGGLSNARNRYSACIRLAIDAGANLVLAPLMQRDNDNLSNTNWRQVGPETMIDVEDLVKNLGESCPGMTVRGCPGGSCDEGKEFSHVVRAPDHDHRAGSLSTGQFRSIVETAVLEGMNFTTSISDLASPSSSQTLKVEFGDSFMAWNYTSTSESPLKKEIFQLLHFSPDLLKLGDIVQAAAKNASHGRDIVGIHFRGEGDWPSSVCNASAQISFYSRELARWNKFRYWKWKLADIYLSCGDQDRVRMFREALRPLGFRVHDKHSLLNSTEYRDLETLREIEELNFDQKAVVEYVNLASSSRFLGLLPSTLSYIVAYQRTLNETFDAPLPAGDAAIKLLKGAGKGRKWEAGGGRKKEGWFERWVLRGSWRGEGLSKHWMEPVEMHGDGKTKLLVVDGQSELSDAFP